MILTKPRVILDALGLPGSVVPSTARRGMSRVVSDVILEAEMVAFSDITGGIDGELYLCLVSHHVKPSLRVLEDPKSRREHCSWSKT